MILFFSCLMSLPAKRCSFVCRIECEELSIGGKRFDWCQSRNILARCEQSFQYIKCNTDRSFIQRFLGFERTFLSSSSRYSKRSFNICSVASVSSWSRSRWYFFRKQMRGPMNVLVRWQNKEKSSSVENDKISFRSHSLLPTAAVLIVDYVCQRTNED